MSKDSLRRQLPGATACGGELVAVGGALPTLIALPTFLNAYVCQQNFLPILAELDRPTPNRKLSLSALTIGVSASVYLVFAWAGA